MALSMLTKCQCQPLPYRTQFNKYCVSHLSQTSDLPRSIDLNDPNLHTTLLENVRKRRPRAPSLFSYAWPLNGFASGFHRATGFALVIGFTGVMIGDGLIPKFERKLGGVLGLIKPVPYAARWCVAFPLTYHWLAGIRHLLWDFGIMKLDNIQHCTYSSAAIMGGSAAAATALAFCRISPRSKSRFYFMKQSH